MPPRLKISGTYVNGILAKTEATLAGFDEAIMLTQDGFVSEGSGENIVNWNGKNDANENVAGGVYFYRIEASNYSKTYKMVFVK